MSSVGESNADAGKGKGKKEKVVCVISGGLDSSVMTYMMHKGGYDVYPLSFRYGQKHAKELDHACAITTFLGLLERHVIVNLESLVDVFKSSALTNRAIPVPYIQEVRQKTQEVLKQTVVPFRNGIFLSIAVAYAQSIECHTVCYAAHASDFATYPDCRPDFVRTMNQAAVIGTEDGELRIIAPFVNTPKSTVVSIGKSFDVPFEMTWSCYKGLEKHCGFCPSCLERKHAFEEAKVIDPTEYQK